MKGVKDLYAYRCGFNDGFNACAPKNSVHCDSRHYKKGYKDGIKCFKKQCRI